MVSADQSDGSGIYRNEETQCFEFWAYEPRTGAMTLLSSCSTQVPDEQLRWWRHQTRKLQASEGHLQPLWRPRDNGYAA
jgi:hypothetical protein